MVEPRFWATPVSNSASPTTMEPITIKLMSLENPENALENGITPNTPMASAEPTAITGNGNFPQTNSTIVTARMISAIVQLSN